MGSRAAKPTAPDSSARGWMRSLQLAAPGEGMHSSEHACAFLLSATPSLELAETADSLSFQSLLFHGKKKYILPPSQLIKYCCLR